MNQNLQNFRILDSVVSKSSIGSVGDNPICQRLQRVINYNVNIWNKILNFIKGQCQLRKD